MWLVQDNHSAPSFVVASNVYIDMYCIMWSCDHIHNSQHLVIIPYLFNFNYNDLYILYIVEVSKRIFEKSRDIRTDILTDILTQGFLQIN